MCTSYTGDGWQGKLEPFACVGVSRSMLYAIATLPSHDVDTMTRHNKHLPYLKQDNTMEHNMKCGGIIKAAQQSSDTSFNENNL